MEKCQHAPARNRTWDSSRRKVLTFMIYIRVIPSNACVSLGGRLLAMIPKRSGKGQNCALVCGGQMEQEGRRRMVKMSLVLVGFRPGPGSSVGRAPAASAGVPGSIPGWDMLAFFHPAELHLSRSFLLSNFKSSLPLSFILESFPQMPALV